MMSMEQNGVGRRVIISYKEHPHYGESGEIIRFEIAKIIRKPAAVIKLDSGAEVMVFSASHIRFL